MLELRWGFGRFIGLALVLAILVSGFAGLVRPSVVVAAGEPPILVITGTGGSNPFSSYVTEILAAEGFKNIEVQPIGNLNSGLLAGRSVVILAETTLSGAQITALDNYVSAGGGLIAMRPVSGLNTILGLATGSGSTSEGYMRIVDGTVGAGLYSDTMQFHGTATHYTLQPGTIQIAELYSSRTASAGQPAVTLANRGSGRAAMFAYDLGRSVAMTRQGNPAQANVDTDGDGVVRSIDIYRNWTDLERSAVPQADVQGRLLSRLIEAVSPQPVPRLWFFPGSAPTVLIATGDAHANPDSYYQTEITQLSQHGAVATFYLTQASAPSAANVAAWRAQGFDFSIHPYVTCGYQCGIDATINWVQSTFGITPRTNRTHQVRWTGWADAASIQASRGLQMDFNSYQWGTWLASSGGPALGYLNGGGLPMRFVDANGNILSIYQQHTSLVDEFLAPQAGLAGLSSSQALAASQATIDAAIDSYHVPVATQFHVDYFYPSNSTWALQTVDYALSRGAISMTANGWLDFVLGRAATTMSNSSWAGNVLTFDVSSGGANQTMLLPLQQRGNSLVGITRNGSNVSYALQTINGTSYAAVNAASGTYAATYASDTTAPEVTSVTPTDGSTGVPVTTSVTVNFSEAMQKSASQAAFSITPNVAGTFSWNGAGTAMTFTPSAVLADSTLYNVALSTGATDLAGNPLAAAANWSFTTAVVTPAPTVTGISPISGPIAGGTTVTITGTTFSGATAVRFGDTNATSFSVVNDTTITATSPARSAGAVHVTVTTPAGTSATVPADQFTYVDASSTMSVTSVDPGLGSSAGGTVVTITGSGFSSGSSVTFDGLAATSVNVLSPTSISATIPAHAPGTVNVVVSMGGGGSATLVNGFTYVDCSALCSIQTTTADFATGVAGTGTALVESTDGEISLAPTMGAEFSGSTVPSGWSVSPWTTGGGSTVANGQLTLDAALLATTTYTTPGRSMEFVATFTNAPHQHIGFGLDLNSSPWAIFSTGPSGAGLFARTNGSGGADTQISGSWLGSPHLYRIEWTSTTVKYFIDGVEVVSHAVGISGGMRPVASDGPLGGAGLAINWIRVSPYAGSGSYQSRIIDSGGATTWDAIFWSANVPTSTSMNLSVRAGNSPTPDGSWTAWTPVGASGSSIGLNGRYLQYSVDLATSNPNATPVLRDVLIAYHVGGTLGPAITSVSPNSGPIGGGTVVTITGSNFQTGATVTVDGLNANVSSVTSTSIVFTTPAHQPGAVNILVTNPDGQIGVLANGYTYLAGQPAISSITPNAGPTTGGTVVTITGANFSGATAVMFGGVAATSFTVVSASEVTAVAPAQAEGVVDIRITTAAGTSAIVTADRFTYVVLTPAPVVTSVDPATASTAGGVTVTVSGSNFVPGMTLRFGAQNATSLALISSSRLTATVPAGDAGTVNVTIINPAGLQNTLVGGFTYMDCSPTCLTDTTGADFSAGTPDASTRVTEIAGGEVRLAAEMETDFSGSSLPAGWVGGQWTPTGTFTVSGGQLIVDSAAVATLSFLSPGRSIEFEATFGNSPFQHAGVGIDLNNVPWMIFSTGSSSTDLYARTNSNLPGTDTLIPGNWLGTPHLYRIAWTATTVTYFIDGQQVAQHNVANVGAVRPIFSDAPAGGASLRVNWVRVSPYASSGTFHSRIHNAGGVVDWGAIGWSADLPGGTSLTMSVRGGNTPTPDGSWTAFAPVAASGATLDLTSQYIQYRAVLTSADTTQTPALRDVTFSYGSAGVAPTVTGIHPATGPITGGTIVTINGSGFANATSVTFGGTSATYTVVSGGQIQATAPAHAAGVVDVVVSNPSGSSTATSASQFTYETPQSTPVVVTGINPNNGTTLGGTAITVTGTGFESGARLVVGGVDATNVVVVNATTITGTTAAHAAGVVGVDVINLSGEQGSLASAFTYVAPPVVPDISGVSPNSGPVAGGTNITVTGTGFVSGARIVVGGIDATNVTFVSATQLTGTTPPHAAGAVSVQVINPAGQSDTLASAFTYVAPPTPAITSVAPNAGPTTGGTVVTISGTNFTGATAVMFGGGAATSFTVVSATEVTAVAPAQAEGVVDVRVTTSAGTSPIVTADRFTYVVLSPAPVITGVNPSVGPTSGGTQVVISGSNFESGMTLRFNGNLATNLTVVSATQLTVTTPAGTAGSADVTITDSAGRQNTLVGGYTYLSCSAACLTDTTSTDFSAGSLDATTRVTEISGGEVRLAAEFESDFSGSTLPAGWNSGQWTPTGSATVSGGQLVVDSALLATNGYYSAGRSIEFEATFGNGPFQHAGIGIDLNNVPWMIFSTGASGTGLYARSNSSLPGTDTLIPGDWLGTPHLYRIDWTATTATYFIDGQQVAQHSVGSIGSVRPVISDGPAGGATLNVNWMRVLPYAGAGTFESRIFDAGATVNWSGISWGADLPTGTSLTMSVRGGNTPTPDGSWTAYTPVASNGASPNVSSRYVQYRAALASTNSSQTPTLRDVMLGYSGQVIIPAVTGISPAVGTTGGGTTVTIGGSGFSNATSVTFGGTPAIFTVVSDLQIQATAPAHAAGVVDVIVTNTSGSSTATTASQFTYETPPAAPDVTSVSPDSGATAGGTLITVTGTGFVSGARIVVGGTDATNVTFVSATQLTGMTPARAAGSVSVQIINPNGQSDTLSSAYSYVAPLTPTIVSVTPNQGTTLGGTRVTISGTNFQSGATVVIGGVQATDVVVTGPTSLEATTGPRSAGLVTVTITNPGGQPGSRTQAYRYVTPPRPTVTSVTPSRGLTTGGTRVTVIGTNFQTGGTVVFGGVEATDVVILSSTSLEATTPPHAAGSVTVSVTNPGSQTGSRSNAYRYSVVTTATAARPGSISVQSGSVTSGSASSLLTNNNGYLVVASAGTSANRTVSFYGEYTVPSARRWMVGLSIAYDGGATATGFDRTISLYNWSSGSWDVLATEAQTTTDKLTTLTIDGDPLRYMDSGGRVRMRIEASTTGNAFSLRADMMTFTVSYLG